MKVGRRLAMKVLNASKFVLGSVGATDPDPAADHRAGRPRAAGRPARHAASRRPRAFDAYDYTTALEVDRAVLLGVLRRLPRAGQGAGVRRGRRRRDPVGQGRPGLRAALLAAPAGAVPALRDRRGLVVVAGGLGPPRPVAGARAAGAGLGRGRRPRRARRRRRGADRHPRRQVAGQGLDARHRSPASRSAGRQRWSTPPRRPPTTCAAPARSPATWSSPPWPPPPRSAWSPSLADLPD